MTTLPSNWKPDATEIEKFIEELAEETGVSRDFLDDARAVIARAFTEVPPERRPECLENIRLTVRMQAETEAAVRSSMESAKRLVQAEEHLLNKLQELKTEARAAKEQAATAALGLLRLQKPSLDMN